MYFSDWGSFFGGLGLFLFGMFLFEETVAGLTTRSFKNLLQYSTNSLWKSLMAGTLSTMAVQSSGIITLLTIWFVGAGIIGLKSAVGIVIWSNIGTTFQGLMIALLGFKFDIASFALPLVALGGVGHLIFSRYETIKKLFLILFGFGLLFLGLDFMNASVESFARSFDFQQFRDYGLFFFFLLGIFLSALMQSSSLANALTLSALHAGIISLPIGMAVVLGTNIGTTSTAILASLGGKSGKRQVAATHLFFNLYSSFIGFIFFTPFLIFITEVLWYRDDPVTGLALYNILFNIVTGVLALPFVNWFTEYIQRVFSTKKEKLDLAIDWLGSDLDEEILWALQKDVRFLLSKVISFNLALFSLSNRNGKIISQNWNFSFSHMMEEYFLLKKIQQRLVAFTMERQLLSKDQDFLEHYRQIVSQINVILYSAKIFKDIYHNLLDLQESDSIILKKMLAVVRKNVSTYYKILQSFIEKKSKLDYAFELKNLLSAMKFSDLFFYRYGKEKNFFQNLEEADFSTILMINRAIYSSSKSLFQWVKNLMLTKEQLEVLRNSK